MAAPLKQQVLQELDAVIAEIDRILTLANRNLDIVMVPDHEMVAAVVGGAACLERIAGRSSEFFRALKRRLPMHKCSTGSPPT
jgi:hypothetical protein